MPFFTKKPVTIEAVQWIGSNPSEIIQFCGGAASYDHDHSEMVIFTLEGKHIASLGDWIIRSVLVADTTTTFPSKITGALRGPFTLRTKCPLMSRRRP